MHAHRNELSCLRTGACADLEYGVEGPGPSQTHPSCHHWENPKDYQLIKQSKNKSRNPVLPSTNKISHWTPLERSSRTARTHIGYIYAIKDNCTILPLQTKSSYMYRIDDVHRKLLQHKDAHLQQVINSSFTGNASNNMKI